MFLRPRPIYLGTIFLGLLCLGWLLVSKDTEIRGRLGINSVQQPGPLSYEHELFSLSHLLVNEYIAKSENYLDQQIAHIADTHSVGRVQLKAHRRDVSRLLEEFDTKLGAVEVAACPGARARIDEERAQTLEKKRHIVELETEISQLKAKIAQLEQARYTCIYPHDMDACIHTPAEGESGECSPDLMHRLTEWSRERQTQTKYSLNFNVMMDWYTELREKDIPFRERLFAEMEQLPACNKSTTELFPTMDTTTSLRPEQIAILSGTDSNSDTSLQALRNREEYSQRHGYQHVFKNFSRWAGAEVEHPVWLKIPAIQETFARHPEVEWIWWLDTDALIMNMDTELISHLLHPAALTERIHWGRPVAHMKSNYWWGSTYWDRGDIDVSNVSFIVSHDMLTINAGSIFIRRSPETDLFLQMWGDPVMIRDSDGDRTFLRREQDAFIDLYSSSLSVRERTALVPQRLINSYADAGIWGEPGTMYQPGDLVIHLAGKRDNEFVTSWEDAVAKTHGYPSLEAEEAQSGAFNQVEDSTQSSEQLKDGFRSDFQSNSVIDGEVHMESPSTGPLLEPTMI